MASGRRRRWGARLSGAGRVPFPCRLLGVLLLPRLLSGQRPTASSLAWVNVFYLGSLGMFACLGRSYL